MDKTEEHYKKLVNEIESRYFSGFTYKRRKKMFEDDLENVKECLERLKDIEKRSGQAIGEHFKRCQYSMYQAAKSFVEAYEAKEKAEELAEKSKEALEDVNNELEEED